MFRRSTSPKVPVSIIPASTSDDQHKEKTKSWSKIALEKLDPDSIKEIMIEICGPDQEYFSIVDVPGISRKTNDGVTTKQDQAMVNAMVRRYMENPRSVMLTVIPANVDIATQEILTMAEEVDKDGHRTLGVLIKPDLVDSGAEGLVIDLIQGVRHKVNLSWCIVRNLGQKQLQDPTADRKRLEEEFFKDTAPWTTLDKDRVGASALRTRLQEILVNNIRHEFKNVRSELNKKLIAARQQLDALGARRENSHEQMRYQHELPTYRRFCLEC